MRIISGQFRGRRLRAPGGRAVRPTGDRMKGSIFSALGLACRGVRVLDLFSGSGALGLEALSRGAESVTFVEKSRESLAALEANIRTLCAQERCRVVRAEVFAFLRQLEGCGGYGLIFADPPFAEDLARPVLEWWVKACRERSVLVLEYPTPEPPSTVEGAPEPVVSRRFGNSSYNIYAVQEKTEGA